MLIVVNNCPPGPFLLLLLLMTISIINCPFPPGNVLRNLWYGTCSLRDLYGAGLWPVFYKRGHKSVVADRLEALPFLFGGRLIGAIMSV